MRLSRFFLPILRDNPKEAEIVSHRLMLRAGMIRQEGAGIYAWLPLGLRVLHKICAVVREVEYQGTAVFLTLVTEAGLEMTAIVPERAFYERPKIGRAHV